MMKLFKLHMHKLDVAAVAQFLAHPFQIGIDVFRPAPCVEIDRLPARLSFHALPICEVELGDIAVADLADADVCYLAATAYPPELMKALAKNAAATANTNAAKALPLQSVGAWRQSRLLWAAQPRRKYSTT